MNIKIKCDECDKFYDDIEMNFMCNNCSISNDNWLDDWKAEEIAEQLIGIIVRNLDNFDAHFGGFKNESERAMFKKGYLNGIEDSGFWVADFFGIVELWDLWVKDKSYKFKTFL